MGNGRRTPRPSPNPARPIPRRAAADLVGLSGFIPALKDQAITSAHTDASCDRTQVGNSFDRSGQSSPADEFDSQCRLARHILIALRHRWLLLARVARRSKNGDNGVKPLRREFSHSTTSSGTVISRLISRSRVLASRMAPWCFRRA